MANQGSIANLKQNIDENIVQNTTKEITGTKMNAVLNNIVDTLNFNGRDFFNVNEYREKSDAYTDAVAGRNAVPDEVKKTGLVITYLLADGWHIDQFVGSDINSWNNEIDWKECGISIFDFQKAIQGTEIIDNTTTISNTYKTVFLPFIEGQTYHFKRISGGNTQITFIKTDGTETAYKITLNQGTSEVDFVSDDNYIGYICGIAGTITIQVTTISINEKINREQNQIDSINDVLEKKVDIAFDNILDVDEIIDGSGVNDSGSVFPVNQSWLGRFGLIKLKWLGNQYITINKVYASGGFAVCQYDENQNFISGTSEIDITGTHTFTRANNAHYIYITLGPDGYLNSSLRANYGQTLTDDTTPPNPIKEYLNGVNEDIEQLNGRVDTTIQGVEKFIKTQNYNTSYNDTLFPILKGEKYQLQATALSGGAIQIMLINMDGTYTPTVVVLSNTTDIVTFTADDNYKGFRAGYAGTATVKFSSFSINEKIKMQGFGDNRKILYAYANGDPSSDTETEFYGWDTTTGKCSIQRAIDAADGIIPTLIYIKGTFKATNTNQFVLQQNGYYNVVFIPYTKNNIQLIGEGADRTRIEVEMVDGFSQYNVYQPMEVWGDNIIVKGMSIFGKNCRYCVHMDASGGGLANDHTITFMDLVLKHFQNNPTGYESTFGLGISDGMILTTERCKFIQETNYTPSLYLHDNIRFHKGYVWKIKDCVFEHTANNNKNGVRLFTIQTLGSNVDGVIEYENNDMGFDVPIIGCENNNAASKTNLENYDANIFVRIKGFALYPLGYTTYNSTSGVLKITSKTVGLGSSVRFDKNSTAFDIIIRGLLATDYTENTGVTHIDGYHYKDGVDVLKGYAMGELALDTNRICSMQNRLGDCSSDNKQLVVTIDGVDYTIVFNQDYSEYTDEQMLAVFTDVIGSVADVELYNWGADYFPEIQPSLMHRKNTSNSAILCGMGVRITSDGLIIATTDDEVDALAIEDIAPGCFGRVVKKAPLSIFESDHHHVCLETYPQTDEDKYTQAFQGYFGIGSNPGVFVKKENGPLHMDWWGYLTINK